MTKSAYRPEHVLVGAGGHARALWDTIKESHLFVKGCLAPSAPNEEWGNRCPWLGTDSILNSFDTKTTKIINGLGSTASITARRRTFIQAQALGFDIITLRHASALVSKNVQFADGIQIMPGTIIQPGAKIGPNVLLNTACVIEHDCQIHAHTHIGPRAVISGGTIIEESVHVGTGAVIIQGVKIGKNSIIGAGTVVTTDIPEDSKVVGNPARFIKFK